MSVYMSANRKPRQPYWKWDQDSLNQFGAHHTYCKLKLSHTAKSAKTSMSLLFIIIHDVYKDKSSFHMVKYLFQYQDQILTTVQ